ncbi:hypothetical protein TVAG_020810 [Trichomonas vaginalis G3]|uniref:Guanylate cyclase domain-containing protein n=1 Tax=Trichomonas vaginalis (strain ATCC PRA-98 / G3) TaxID=412133 RepID=A2G7J6_TRIV3|nr:hypothetical protein TVAG_020810 [Trichomonas vaginalis G3]|eukprot:XP_001299801.1 hypothetical protein [Trichomonas vaginalis G3]
MADYAVDGNPMSSDLLNIYSDYLMKYDGDFVTREKLTAKDKTKYLLIKKSSKDEGSLKLNNPQEEQKDEFENTYNLYHQKAIDILPIYPVIYMKIISTILVVMLIFPIYSTALYIRSSKFVPSDYFQNTNSPSFFKITMSLENINMFFESFNETLITKNSSLNIVNKISYRSIEEYLNTFTCPIDEKPIVAGAMNQSKSFLEYYYDIMSNRLIFYSDDENGWHSLRETHCRLHTFTQLLEPVINRYFNCAKLIVNEKNSVNIKASLGVSVFFLLWLLFFVTFIPKRYLKKIITVLKGIEVATLEEFRSNLFITLNTLMSPRRNNPSTEQFEVDNDGALELEELEVYENNHRNETVDINQLDTQQPFSVGFFDPARHYTYYVYTVLIFIVKYGTAFFVFWGMNIRKISIVGDSIMFQDRMDHFSALFIEIDALMSNVTGVNDEFIIIPQKTFLHEEYTYSDNMKQIFDNWNRFVDEYCGNYSFSNSKVFIKNILEDSMKELDQVVLEQYKRLDLVSIKYFDFTYWVVSCILICIFILMSFRFIAFMYIMMSNARHIAIIIHSKYSPTVSNLVTALTPQFKSNKKMNLVHLCETVVSQMRDPVIFFDAELVITGCNQQASADLGYRVDDLQGCFLENVLEERRNRPFYEFVCSMFTPLGVCCKRYINVFARSNDMSLIEYNAMLMPILDNNSVYRINGRGELTHFALLMRNQNEINAMKNELTQLENHVNMQLRRLVPHFIAKKMIDGTIQNSTTVERCAFLVATTRTYNEYISDEDKIVASEDITELFMSHIDKIIPNYKDIIRIRTLNGVFFFVCGFYQQRDDKENLNTLFNFTKDIAKSITSSIDSYNVPILLSFVIKCGGPAHVFLSGISKTLYDIYSETMIEAFEISDVVPCGKVMITSEEYDVLDDRSEFVKYNPDREVKYELYVNHGFIGIE